MTDKEIEIQRALGTLPLWKKLELGEADFEEKEDVVPATFIHVTITCDGFESSYWKISVHEDRPTTKEQAIEDIKRQVYAEKKD